MQSDTELYKIVEEMSQRWFKQSLAQLSMDMRVRMIPYIYHSNKTTAAQLARVLGLPREQVEGLIKQKGR